MCMYTHTCIFKDQKNIHQNVNSGIMREVYFSFGRFLSLPQVIHINIFITEEQQLTFRKLLGYCLPPICY